MSFQSKIDKIHAARVAAEDTDCDDDEEEETMNPQTEPFVCEKIENLPAERRCIHAGTYLAISVSG